MATTVAPTATPPQTSSTPVPTSSPTPAAAADSVPTRVRTSGSSNAPADAPLTASSAPAPAPAPLPAAPATFGVANENQPPQTRRQRLDVGDRGWMWKLLLRAVACISAIIGIGCIAWAFATVTGSFYPFAADDQWTIVWGLITLGLSLLWCFICIVVYLIRCPHKPVHPGAQVGVDLIIWLGLIATGLLCVGGALSLSYWGSSGTIYVGDGYYQQASNGTWVWNATEYNSVLGRQRGCNASSSYQSSSYYEYAGFASCAEVDAYVNNLWKQRPHRLGAEITGSVCQFLNLLIHFTLFIWACVDTHRRRTSKVGKKAEKLASEIVMRMVTTGAVVRPPNDMAQPLLRPEQQQMQYPPIQPQWYPQYPQYGPQQPQQPHMMSGAVGSSPPGSAPGPSAPAQAPLRDEKQTSTRFA